MQHFPRALSFELPNQMVRWVVVVGLSSWEKREKARQESKMVMENENEIGNRADKGCIIGTIAPRDKCD